jgi:hypothetical protein
MYGELVHGWHHLSTSSKLLIVYYLAATMVEVQLSFHLLTSGSISQQLKGQLIPLPSPRPLSPYTSMIRLWQR